MGRIALCILLLFFTAASSAEDDQSTLEYDRSDTEEVDDEKIDLEAIELEEIEFEEVEFEEVDSEVAGGQEESSLSRIVLSLGHTLSDSDQLSSSTRLLRLRGRLDFERALHEQWFVGAKLQLTHYGGSDEQGQIAGHSITHYQTDELWLQYSHQRCMAQMGQQRLIWGVVEGAFVVDVATPFNFTEQLLTDFSSIRESQTMLVGNCYFGDFSSRQHLQLFITPNAKRNLYKIEPPATLQSGNSRHDHSEWGGRWHIRFEKLELALIAAELLNDDMVLSSHERQRFLGASLLWGEGQWLWQAEVGRSREVSGEVDVAIGLEYTTLSNHYISVGVTQSEREPLAEGALVKPETEQRYVINWQKSFLNDRFTVSGLWLRQYRDGYKGADTSSVALLAQYECLDNVQLGAAVTTTAEFADRFNEITYRITIFY